NDERGGGDPPPVEQGFLVIHENLLSYMNIRKPPAKDVKKRRPSVQRIMGGLGAGRPCTIRGNGPIIS
ncbi:MAG TPA: hypothetical protein P5146_14120, partial [Desulfomonilia bacterium]|nr:hypothetical protein [Desulfomonilia bacterium]